jgi:hypothetical protein
MQHFLPKMLHLVFERACQKRSMMQLEIESVRREQFRRTPKAERLARMYQQRVASSFVFLWGCHAAL